MRELVGQQKENPLSTSVQIQSPSKIQSETKKCPLAEKRACLDLQGSTVRPDRRRNQEGLGQDEKPEGPPREPTGIQKGPGLT